MLKFDPFACKAFSSMHLRQMGEMLPTVDTPLLKVSYRMEVSICHEGFLSSSKDLPSMWFDFAITKNP